MELTRDKLNELQLIVNRAEQDEKSFKRKEVLSILSNIEVPSPKTGKLITINTLCTYLYGCLLKGMLKEKLIYLCKYLIAKGKQPNVLGFFE